MYLFFLLWLSWSRDSDSRSVFHHSVHGLVHQGGPENRVVRCASSRSKFELFDAQYLLTEWAWKVTTSIVFTRPLHNSWGSFSKDAVFVRVSITMRQESAQYMAWISQIMRSRNEQVPCNAAFWRITGVCRCQRFDWTPWVPPSSQKPNPASLPALPSDSLLLHLLTNNLIEAEAWHAIIATKLTVTKLATVNVQMACLEHCTHRPSCAFYPCNKVSSLTIASIFGTNAVPKLRTLAPQHMLKSKQACSLVNVDLLNHWHKWHSKNSLALVSCVGLPKLSSPLCGQLEA